MSNHYSAKSSYTESQARTYEADRFSSLLGRYRDKREHSAVRRLLNEVGRVDDILDVPCGIGRWWPELLPHGNSLRALDISPGMIQLAQERMNQLDERVSTALADAEALSEPSDHYGLVFCFALFKHLPRQVQYRVLAELARVSNKYVIVAVGVMNVPQYALWCRRPLVESYPMFARELTWMAESAGLSVVRSLSCTTPIGVEKLVLLKKDRPTSSGSTTN